MKIGYKLFIFFILVLLIPRGFLSVAQFQSSQSSLRKQIYSKLDAIATDRKNAIELYIEDQLSLSEIMASRTFFVDYLHDYLIQPSATKKTALENSLSTSLKVSNSLRLLEILSFDGQVLFTTAGSQPATHDDSQPYILNGKLKSGFYVINQNGNAEFIITTPIIRNGESLAILKLAISKEPLEQIVKNRTGLGNSGEVVLSTKVDQNYFYLFPLRYGNRMTNTQNHIPRSQAMQNALAKKETIIPATVDYRGVSIAAATRYLTNANIGLVVKIDSEEINAPLQNDLRESLIVSAITLLLALIFGYFISRSIASPLDVLGAKAEEIRKGNLNVNFPLFLLKRTDEIGQLTTTLSNMTIKLREIYVDLENRINDRTQQLTLAKKQLEDKLTETERMNKVMVDRELKMISLKEELAGLKKEGSK